jgi:hypothetical protein
MTRKHLGRNPRRPSFTLVEILVVIAIIVALMALAVGAVMRFLQTQAQKNTESIIGRIDSTLDKQWRYVISAAMTEPIPDGVVALAGGKTDRARVIYVKLRLKQEFPMGYYEALNPNGLLPPIADYVTKLNAAGIFFANYPPPPAYTPPTPDETSACLLMALERNRGGARLTADDLGKDTVRTNSFGLKMLVDFWGTPLLFYRWPTLDGGVDAANPATPGSRAVTLRDLQDGDGTLLDPSWWSNGGNTDQPTNRFYFEANIHLISKQVPPPAAAPPPYVYDVTQMVQAAPYAYYMVPVIVSAGPNKKFGILPAQQPYINPTPGGNPVVTPAPGPWPDPMQLDGSSASNDNIYSYRLRLGGSGN